ncbi:hypothetical protein CBR_g44526 [Chara braunii]|uniref:CCHC-type domain-containing protein n=1 Tax=Chara braunii TaxID=69332 RepID=A0A388LXL6_CHABU|nr:hypothetical protein CBR_g44526 [Chara braunii]|eukprot:GBG87070.1 hypothetical protein CBR_g44526 [Chara braunii]
MTSVGNANVQGVRACYNCGQPGHISRYCPLPDRRLNASHVPVSKVLVPTQPLLTVPLVPNVGTSVPYYSGQYNNGGSGLGRRVSTLEEIVSKINGKHEAEEAKERARREDEERKKRDVNEEERRVRDRKERDKLHKELHKEMTGKLDKVCEAVNGKNVGENEEIAKLRAQVESLDEIASLKAEIEVLRRGHPGASTSATVSKPNRDAEELSRLRVEQAEAKAFCDWRFASFEEVIIVLQRQCEAAEANADVWRSETLRPGNKRGSVAIGATPASDARVRARVASPKTGRVNLDLKGIVERHQMEVDHLKEMRLREVNARKEPEEEIGRLKEAMAKLGTRVKAKGTNLKAKLDDAAGVSMRKTSLRISDDAGGASVRKGKAADNPTVQINNRDAFLCDARKDLRKKNKEEILAICEKEGLTYSTLEPAKEAIAHLRTARAFDKDERGKGKANLVVEVSEEAGGSSDKEDVRDFACS